MSLTNIELTSEIPIPKKPMRHKGKRRRSYTEEMFRCQFTDMISRTPLVCNHLLWKEKISELRMHLCQHKVLEDVQQMTDDQVRNCYLSAARIHMDGVTDDEPEEE